MITPSPLGVLAPLQFFDFFAEFSVNLGNVDLGVAEFLSALEFSPFGSSTRLRAGLGVFDFGEFGELNEVTIPLPVELLRGGDFGRLFFFKELNRSKVITRLQAGCKTGRPLI